MWRQNRAYLLNPFCSKLRRLLALDSQCWDWQDQITLLERLRPLESRVDDRPVDACYLCQDFGEMCSVHIDRVDFWVATGKPVQRTDAQ
jgi:hypothetical protein